jgi:hypothetical protein
MGQQGKTEGQRKSERQATTREHERDVEAYKQRRPPEVQRDTTSLGALAKTVQQSREQSKPLASRPIGTTKPLGLMKPGARSMHR